MKTCYGIDVSGWDQVVDWPRLKKQGFVFAMIKSSQGLATDSTFASHWQGAKDAGFLRGAYHFYTQNQDPQAQAKALLKLLADDPGELPPAVDVEHEVVFDANLKKNVTMPIANPAKYVSRLHTLLAAIETQLKRTPFIYTALGVWNEVTSASGGAPAWAAQYPLWVANYPNSLFRGDTSLLSAVQLQSLFNDIDGGVKYKGFPALPSGWKTWKVWQFSAEKFFLDGLATLDEDHKVVPFLSDLDVYPGTEEELRAWAGAGPAVVSTPDDTTSASSAAIDTTGSTASGSAPGPQPAATGKTLPKITNQAMINVFFKAFGEPNYFEIAKAAGLESMAVPDSNRNLMYSGPAIEDLPLSEDQKQALLNALP